VKINSAGLELLKDFEKCKLTAYKCRAGVWTIGWGHTGADVYEGLTITKERADELFALDLEQFEGAVNWTCPKVNQNQFDALVCFCFNVGAGAFRNSRLAKYVNQSKPLLVATEFMRWVHVKGKVSEGLVNRRKAERELFLNPGRTIPPGPQLQG
jgi:lysozyme